MKCVLLMILFLLIKGQIEDYDEYEELINEKVSEEYCNDVITNLSTVIDELYIYSDFIKAPRQPEGYDNYIPKVDLVKELNAINKKDRYFFDFYRDIKNVLEKTRDGHFSFGASRTPNNLDLYYHYFCIPFRYKIKEIFNEENILNDTYLTIESREQYQDDYSKEIIEKIGKLEGKKITKINNKSPYEYLDEMGTKYNSVHSPQARYILISLNIHNLYVDLYPFKKEELNISLDFEDNESLQLEYQYKELKFDNQEFKQYFIDEKNKFLKGYYSILDFEQLKYKFKIKKGIISNKVKKEVNWDIMDEEELIKCKVDDENKYNVIYQNSFSPSLEYFEEYEMVMEECLEKFYSNDYKIIIIEDRNGGGYVDLCEPFTEYLRPKINKGDFNAIKSSQMNLDYITSSQVLNPETCLPYTDKDNILEGTEDKYSDEVIHKKSKIFDSFDVYYKKYVQSNRKYFLTGKTKKPTEIIIFTDGYSFSCTSILITGLQAYGGAIIVGYNSRPDLEKKYFDASQSNSGVTGYEDLEVTRNLNNLGYSIYITNNELFSPNDKNNPKTPLEFSVNPVDEISEIYQNYDDEIYDRFIKEADKIFKKYNDLENGECNPDNKYLFYETSDCDSKLNIEKAHGGYLCGNDGKWDKNKCIAAYCDDEYILNDERTKCIKDLCEEINIVEKTLNITKQEEFIIEPKTFYYFYIEDDSNSSYYFLSEQDNFMYYYGPNKDKVFINNQTLIEGENGIYINYYLNISQKSKLIVKENKNSTHYNNFYTHRKKSKKLSAWKIVLIVIGLLLGIIIILLILKLSWSLKNDVNMPEITNTNLNDKSDLKIINKSN